MKLAMATALASVVVASATTATGEDNITAILGLLLGASGGGGILKLLYDAVSAYRKDKERLADNRDKLIEELRRERLEHAKLIREERECYLSKMDERNEQLNGIIQQYVETLSGLMVQLAHRQNKGPSQEPT